MLNFSQRFYFLFAPYILFHPDKRDAYFVKERVQPVYFVVLTWM